MIQSFGNNATGDIFNGVSSKKALGIPKVLWPAAQRKLDMLNAAYEISDLKSPPGNRLEKLGGKYAGYHGIRLNDQFRLIFRWVEHNAYDVQITDYH